MRHCVDCLAEVSILEKCAVSIFRAEVIMLDSEGLYRMAGGEVLRKGLIRTQ
jgi:hypothetical protein